MPLPCPRCRATLLRSVDVDGAEERYVLDTCDRCHGLWLDVPELRALAGPVATYLEEHADELQTRRNGEGIARCPACGGATEEFRYASIWLDHCRACGGVWLDGHEHEGLAALIARRARTTTQTYRDAPVETRSPDRARCVVCSKIVPLRNTLITGDGLVCTSCSRAALKESVSAVHVPDVAEDAPKNVPQIDPPRRERPLRHDAKCEECGLPVADCTCHTLIR